MKNYRWAVKLKDLATQELAGGGRAIYAIRLLKAANEICENAAMKEDLEKMMKQLRDDRSEVSDFEWRTLLQPGEWTVYCRVRGDKQVEEFASGSKCWFCGNRNSDVTSTIAVDMYNRLYRSSYIVLFSNKIIKVPRCKECASKNESNEKLASLTMISGGIAGVVLAIIVGAESWLVYFACLLVGAIGGLFIGMKIGRKSDRARGIVRDESSWPAVAEARTVGFIEGKTPRGADSEEVLDL